MAHYPFRKNRADQAKSIWKDISVDNFPENAVLDDLIIKSEREFHLMICCSHHIQRSLGWQGIVNSQVFYPDVTADLGNGDHLRVELEFDASNFWRHRHGFGGCDLIVTFLRRPGETMIAGVPVWSFYERKNSIAEWTLFTDIRENSYECEYSIDDEVE
jgi:hypothetical protein